MKKINLRGLQEKLSTKELRNVMGGSVDGSIQVNHRCYSYGEVFYFWGFCAGSDCETCITYKPEDYGISVRTFNVLVGNYCV